MRRKDREVLNTGEINEIINSCKVFRLAMSVNDIPYIVPLNYGYKYFDGQFEFYFHCANQGKKVDMLKDNSRVCFEIDSDHQLTVGDIACEYGYNYKSVIGLGNAIVVKDVMEKSRYLNIIMKHQTGSSFTFTEEEVKYVTVFKIRVSEITAKKREEQVSP